MKTLILLGFFLCLTAKAELKILIVDTGLSLHRSELLAHVDESYKYGNDYHDLHGHGTHVTSIILRNACPSVKIIPCKFYNKEEELTNLDREVKCLELGLKHNVDLVNMSLSGIYYNRKEHRVLKKYEKRGIPVNVALGNEGSAIKHKSYPADLNLKNMNRIGALEGRGFASTSNRRSNARYYQFRYYAAGIQNKSLVMMQGTSQATAYFTNLKVKEYCKKQLTNK